MAGGRDRYHSHFNSERRRDIPSSGRRGFTFRPNSFPPLPTYHQSQQSDFALRNSPPPYVRPVMPIPPGFEAHFHLPPPVPNYAPSSWIAYSANGPYYPLPLQFGPPGVPKHFFSHPYPVRKAAPTHVSTQVVEAVSKEEKIQDDDKKEVALILEGMVKKIEQEVKVEMEASRNFLETFNTHWNTRKIAGRNYEISFSAPILFVTNPDLWITKDSQPEKDCKIHMPSFNVTSFVKETPRISYREELKKAHRETNEAFKKLNALIIKSCEKKAELKEKNNNIEIKSLEIIDSKREKQHKELELIEDELKSVEKNANVTMIKAAKLESALKYKPPLFAEVIKALQRPPLKPSDFNSQQYGVSKFCIPLVPNQAGFFGKSQLKKLCDEMQRELQPPKASARRKNIQEQTSFQNNQPMRESRTLRKS